MFIFFDFFWPGFSRNIFTIEFAVLAIFQVALKELYKTNERRKEKRNENKHTPSTLSPFMSVMIIEENVLMR